jgi:hypothetical protein
MAVRRFQDEPLAFEPAQIVSGDIVKSCVSETGASYQSEKSPSDKNKETTLAEAEAWIWDILKAWVKKLTIVN